MQFVKNKLQVECSSLFFYSNHPDYYIKADIMSWTIGKTTTATTEGEKDMKYQQYVINGAFQC